MTAPTDRVPAYRGVMDRVTALVADLDEQHRSRTVPATPAWTVGDLLAHMVGVAADTVVGNVAEAGSDPWTATQVEARRGRSPQQLLAEWESLWPQLAERLDALKPFRSGQVVFDVVTHEHDLRGAIDRPGARDSDALEIAWAWSAGIVGQMRDGFGAGALVLRTEDGDLVVGAGEPTATVAAPRFELWRAMTGRRSAAQVLAFEWQGEPAVDHLCFLPAREGDLIE